MMVLPFLSTSSRHSLTWYSKLYAGPATFWVTHQVIPVTSAKR